MNISYMKCTLYHIIISYVLYNNVHMNKYIIMFINIMYCTLILSKICTLLYLLVFQHNVRIVRIVHIAKPWH